MTGRPGGSFQFLDEAAQTMASFEPFAEMTGVAPESRKRSCACGFQFQLAVVDGKIFQRLFAADEEDILVPVGHGSEGAVGGGDRLDSVRVVARLKFAQVVSIDDVDLAFFSGGYQHVGMGAGLIGEQDRAAGAEIVIALVELSLIRGREVIEEL